MNQNQNTIPHQPIEHECPYIDRLHRYRTLVGAGALTSDYIESTFVPSLHKDGNCPPTHDANKNPTVEWEEMVDYTRV